MVMAYGSFEAKKQHAFNRTAFILQGPEWLPYNRTAFIQSLGDRDNEFLGLAKRPNGVAWIVSHCETASKREDYVKELMEHIPGRTGQAVRNVS